MLALVIVSSCLLAVDGPEGTPAPADPIGYRDAAAAAGRNADAHVRLALWCEAHGMTAERLRHLTMAVLANPSHAAARGLMGLVDDGGKWRGPEAVTERVRGDAATVAALAEYEAKRADLPHTAPAHWHLALWCEEKGLKAEATAHLVAVTRLDPSRADAWLRLGYKKQRDGRWMTDARLHALKAEADAQAVSDRHWKADLETWRGWLGRKTRRTEAEVKFAGITDPRAVPSITRVFGSHDQARAVQLLGQIDATSASRALAILAVFGKSAEVRRAATESLAQRDPREFLDLLIGFVRKPMRYQSRPVNGPGSRGALRVEGQKYNVERYYDTPPLLANPAAYFDISGNPYAMAALQRRMYGTPFGVGPDPALAQALQQAAGDPAHAVSSLSRAIANRGTGAAQSPGLAAGPFLPSLGSDPFRDEMQLLYAQAIVQNNVREYQRAVGQAQERLESDIAAVEATNASITFLNQRTLPVLHAVTGQEVGDDSEAWAKWWADQQGYAYQAPPVPTFVQVALAAEPQLTVTGLEPKLANLHHSCFAGGTPVRTLSGLRPIETLQVGDRILTQDTSTGTLSYQPILAAYHNAPNQTLRIRFAEDSIVATGIHRFWKAGKGWVMARELKPGDAIRTLGGLAKVTTVAPDTTQPVFNLEVAAGQSFFAGPSGILVHDNSLIEPTRTPFDAERTVLAGRN